MCVQETHGKDDFLQALTFVLDNVNAGGSALFLHQNLLPDGATVTHE